MAEITFPAVLVLARIDREAGKVVAFKDNRILESDKEFTARRLEFRRLEELGGANYLYRLAEVASADQVVEEQRAALEYEAGFRDTPDLDPEPEPETAPSGNGDHLAEAYTLARQAFKGSNPQLRRLARALELVERGAVIDRGNGEWWVKSDYYGTWTVNGGCTCPDAQRGGRRWCKHRLAVALTLKARQLQEAAGSAGDTPAAETAPNGDNSQPDYTPGLDLAQVKAIRPVWGKPEKTALDLLDGGQQVVDTSHKAAEAQAQAAGWKEGTTGAGYWMNPAHDWEAETRASQAAWEARLAS